MPPMMHAGTASPGRPGDERDDRNIAPTPMTANGQVKLLNMSGTNRVTRKRTPSRMSIVPATRADLDLRSMRPPFSHDGEV